MKSMLVSVAVVLFASAITGTLGQCLTANDNPETLDRESGKLLTQARTDFAFDVLKKTAQISSQENIFFSPHSLHEALILAYLSAGGSTEEALKTGLQIPQNQSKVDVQRFYGLENSLRRFRELGANGSSTNEFRTANKLWVTSQRRVKDCMLALFSEELEQVDFRTNPEAIRKTVNDWASNTTKGHIKDLIPNGGVTEDSDLILANAVYFKGLWKSRFDPANSRKDIFYTNGSRSSLVTFMRQKGTFSHVVSEEIGAHVLELPYKGDAVSMFVLLPPFVKTTDDQASIDSISQLVQRITETERGQGELRAILREGMAPREVEISLPKFSVDKELPVGQLLNALGAGEILTPSANLKGLLADGEPSLHLGDAVHRAVVEVTEEGTTAAAATALFSFRSSRPAEPAIFKADHPFVYFIYDKPSQSILFAGVYRTPPPPKVNTYA